MSWNCRFFVELIKGFMVFYFVFVRDSGMVKFIEDEGEISGIKIFLIVVIKVNFLPRDNIREV